MLPSSHEGLPIALLEALSFGLPVLASDIPANLDVGLPSGSYFPLGDVAALATAMRARAASCPVVDEERRRIRAWVAARFDWNDIARRTLEVYRGVVDRKDAVRPSQGNVPSKRASRAAEQ
ncbi:MAG: glycosyltransferase [Gammaproteobacteria bacterium]|nr:glycosyltransferase [Gammaproteobacteria bacterium]